MENLELILSLLGTSASLVFTMIIVIIKFIRCRKTSHSLEDEYELYNSISKLMEIAEEFTNYSGEEKKEFVITKLNQFAIENCLKFDVNKASNKIEELIMLSKNVNYKGEKNE